MSRAIHAFSPTFLRRFTSAFARVSMHEHDKPIIGLAVFLVDLFCRSFSCRLPNKRAAEVRMIIHFLSNIGSQIERNNLIYIYTGSIPHPLRGRSRIHSSPPYEERVPKPQSSKDENSTVPPCHAKSASIRSNMLNEKSLQAYTSCLEALDGSVIYCQYFPSSSLN